MILGIKRVGTAVRVLDEGAGSTRATGLFLLGYRRKMQTDRLRYADPGSLHGHAAGLDRRRPFLDFALEELAEIFRRGAVLGHDHGAERFEPLLTAGVFIACTAASLSFLTSRPARLSAGRWRSRYRLRGSACPARDAVARFGSAFDRSLVMIAIALTVPPSICGLAVVTISHRKSMRPPCKVLHRRAGAAIGHVRDIGRR